MYKSKKIGKEKTTKPAPAAEKEANPAANNKTQPSSEDEAAQLRIRNAEIEKKIKKKKRHKLS